MRRSTPFCLSPTIIEISEGFLADHRLEVGDGFPRLNEQQNGALNRHNSYGLRFGEVVATDGHTTRNGRGRGRSVQGAVIDLSAFRPRVARSVILRFGQAF